MSKTQIQTVFLSRTDLRHYLRIEAIIQNGDYAGSYEIWKNPAMPAFVTPKSHSGHREDIRNTGENP